MAKASIVQKLEEIRKLFTFRAKYEYNADSVILMLKESKNTTRLLDESSPLLLKSSRNILTPRLNHNVPPTIQVAIVKNSKPLFALNKFENDIICDDLCPSVSELVIINYTKGSKRK